MMIILFINNKKKEFFFIYVNPFRPATRREIAKKNFSTFLLSLITKMRKVCFVEQKSASVRDGSMLPFGKIRALWVKILKNSILLSCIKVQHFVVFSFIHKVYTRK